MKRVPVIKGFHNRNPPLLEEPLIDPRALGKLQTVC